MILKPINDVYSTQVSLWAGYSLTWEDARKSASLSNEYFLAAISALAKYPHILEAVFLTDEYNTSGIYAI